jgi:hypothetical protein
VSGGVGFPTKWWGVVAMRERREGGSINGGGGVSWQS